MKSRLLLTALLIGLPAVALAAPGQKVRDDQAHQGRIRFQAMDTNGDGMITRDEWRGSDQSFRVHDWNGDGVLSGNEVRIGGSREYGEDDDDYDQTGRPVFRNWTERGFANLDRNHDGKISRYEWFYDREGFVRADRNGDGTLTRAEFLGLDADADRDDRFEYLDVNHDGRIERSEWHASADAFAWLDRNHDGVLSRVEVMGQDVKQADLFAGLDVNHDNAITPDEWQWSRRSFALQDRNGDGQLTRDELTNAELSAVAGSGNAVGTTGRAIVVDAARGWVDTGIDVRYGDVIAIEATGTATLSENSADVSDPNGARSGRRAINAPLPNQKAGALIARINNGSVALAGSRQTIPAYANGRLYLAVNDDYFGDNRGEYRVTVSVRRQ